MKGFSCALRCAAPRRTAPSETDTQLGIGAGFGRHCGDLARKIDWMHHHTACISAELDGIRAVLLVAVSVPGSELMQRALRHPSDNVGRVTLHSPLSKPRPPTVIHYCLCALAESVPRTPY